MTGYDLSRLSSLDFEELTHDLLEAEWKTHLEAFTAGRDGGIDLRRIETTGSTIIQCKHFVGSGFAKLLSHLRKDELPKVQRLAPARYVLVTSVDLSPANKARLMEVLSPYVTSPDDIIGAAQIQHHLRSHPDVETTHYKLWLTSTAVLERVLHSAEKCQTDFRIERIQKKLPLYVQSAAYPRAAEMLNKNRVVVISGQPGIGKSTLAEMLVFASLEAGYEPVVIESDLSEGRKFFRRRRKQIFYFDDFLGQTYLGDRPEYLGKNQDASLADFVELIGSSPNARFVLTTREHILSGALQRSEKLAHSGIADQKCVIQLADYQRSQKARILYNHLYFSDLPEVYRKEIVADDFFLDIINHKHFNPRIIEWLASYSKIKSVRPEDYRRHVIGLLEEPELIWTHAFETQISTAARTLLIALHSLGFQAEVDDLETAFHAMHSSASRRYNRPTSPNDYRRALKELDGAFISISRSSVTFANPSIREFIAGIVARSEDYIRDIIESAIRFRQAGDLWRLGDNAKYLHIRQKLLEPTLPFVATLRRLTQTPHLRWRQTAHGRVGTYLDHSPQVRVAIAAEIAEAAKSDVAVALVRDTFSHLSTEWRRVWPEVGDIIYALSAIESSPWLHDRGGKEWIAAGVEQIEIQLQDARSGDWISLLEALSEETFWKPDQAERIRSAFLEDYCEDGVRNEISDSTSVSELEELKSNLESLQRDSGHDFRYEIGNVEERIEDRSERDSSPRDSRHVEWSKPPEQETPIDDETIVGMFKTLLDQ